MSSLLDPPDEAQRLLLHTVWEVFAEHGKFPMTHYVDYKMREAGHDTTTVLHSFPAVGHHLRGSGYQAITWWGSGRPSPDNGPVGLTLAGLRQIDDERAAAIGNQLLTFMRALTQARQQIANHPFEMPNLTLQLRETLERAGVSTKYGHHAAVVADQEWPGLRFTYQSSSFGGFGELGHLARADFSTLDDYVAAVAAELAPTPAPTALYYAEPRALLRTLNFLDLTCEVVLQRTLVPRFPTDRVCRLALPVDDEAGFNTGVIVLAELLGSLNVPKTKSQPPFAPKRIGDWLASQLPRVDEDAVNAAVEILLHIQDLRNSSVHPKQRPELIAAHHALGLPFPIKDHAAAWDSVRAYADRALSVLQEEIQAVRATRQAEDAALGS
ncbi:hypothetical protein [Kitasatospora sp. NPDC058218]|uniref:hypothetical protein n=1 Tax=Kitasatospora sp. NPDC058218 TaxID=3346385 RepID=UPI0036DA401D